MLKKNSFWNVLFIFYQLDQLLKILWRNIYFSGCLFNCSTKPWCRQCGLNDQQSNGTDIRIGSLTKNTYLIFKFRLGNIYNFINAVFSLWWQILCHINSSITAVTASHSVHINQQTTLNRRGTGSLFYWGYIQFFIFCLQI